MLLHKIKTFAVILCAAAIIGAATAGYAQDYSAQLDALRRDAQAGDAEAANNLGETYHNGWGVEKNEEEAVNWYLVAAKEDNAVAEFNVGRAYSTGHGIKKDEKEALGWYQKAAAQGSAAALNSLGDVYFFGQGVPKDKTVAVDWYRKAANFGNADAEYSLGEAYHNGDGVAKDDKQAVILYKKALDSGNAQANARLMEIEGAQPGSFHMKNALSPGWLLIIAVSAICLMFFIVEMKKKGAELYELKFLLCPQFGLLIVGSIFFYVTNMPTAACDPNGQDVLFCDSGGNDFAKWVSLMTFAAALTMNINRSNPSFGTLYTLAQLVTAYTFFPAFLVEMFKKTSKPSK